VESLDSLIAPFESGFRMPPAAARQSAVILSATELRAQPFCPALAENKQHADGCNHNHRDRNDYGDLCCT
jgi:hypothetical protein